MDIRVLIGKKMLYFDGGLGTLLQAEGLQPGEEPERWNIEHPDIIENVHFSYYEAGCHIVTTDSLGCNELNFPDEGTFSVENIARAAVENANRARQRADQLDGGAEPRFIAFSIGSLGRLLKPLGTMRFEDAYQVFSRTVRAASAAGADILHFETINDLYEVKAAVLAAKENSDLPVFVTMTYDENGRLMTGGDVPGEVALLEGLGVDALGINCGLGPAQMKPIALKMLEYASVPMVVNPNAGLPSTVNGKTVYSVGPEKFAAVMEDLIRAGVWIAGGCCGTTPAHMSAMIKRCKDITPLPLTKKNRSLVCGTSKTVEIGPSPVIIGERINPTGKKKFKEALRTHDIEYIVREGIKQQDSGAHVLDVNVGLPEIDETQMMADVVYELQSVIGLPLQIDTTNPETMEKALRLYNGKALVNSVNGKQAVMDQIFPLVKKYGGVVLALTLDEDGIPSTAEGRLEIAEKIYKTAESYGIEKKDILIDALAMTISSEPKAAEAALGTLDGVRERFGGNTVLGVSNISFGLPQREVINSTFYAMALSHGLSAAIINPNSDVMMRAYYAYRALSGLDTNCQEFIEKAPSMSTAAAAPSQASTAPSAVSSGFADSLGACIERGLKEGAAAYAAEMLKDHSALDIINEELIPGLNRVGKDFEKGRAFLPQLLMSAESAKAAFEVLKSHMSVEGEVREKKGTIVLATVKGDIHDIGKNIVKVLLENYDYEVIDLGKDVDPEIITEKVVGTHAKYCGLSALMTTTVPAMEETIKQLRAAAPWCKVMVGGAVMTQAYADMIGADAYCKDAMAGVSYAESN
ncbi:MAG: homocysteine S-methyltransferase family protein [Anaerolineaceae bacterium]|nr:homocysteine S-methyltransferase family protein [Anaerolineaceae bacterium]